MAVMLLSLIACKNNPFTASDEVSFTLNSSHDRVYVGESVTVWARTSNVIGEQPKVVWSTTGGDLTEKKNGSVAQITFDEPGSFDVAGRLTTANGVDQMDRVTVHVMQLP